ncbi:Transcriptional regulator of nonfermentable carbon utilization [Rhizina undulata]
MANTEQVSTDNGQPPTSITTLNGANGANTTIPSGINPNLVRPATAGSGVSAASSKDPSRPRRKKARRACFACQRAHLTCGDERPCQRCIKRGLQDACHDGVRKKAKYLHDAPLDDAPAEFAPQPPSSSASSYPYHQPPPPQVEMLPPDGTINPNSIESPNNGLAQQPDTAAPLFDPSDPALFNFDIASLNFGSQYGALEFGVLGQMSSSAQAGQVGTPDNGSVASYGCSPRMGAGEGYVGFSAPQGADNTQFNDGWPHTRNNSTTAHHQRGNNAAGAEGGFANTYMIEAGPGSLTSPSPPIESPRQNFMPNPTQPQYTEQNTGNLGSPSFYQPTLRQTQSQPSSLQQVQSVHPPQPIQRRRRLPEDPSQIYSTVTKPYPYTLHFHRLFHLLESRFPKPLLLRIARAMASFRPSFIACTQTLKADDLLFMEKCFQRTLWEYERFIQSCGTPTIVCRRTGEVVGVGKEFCMLTGWEKAILLGEKQNLNTNVPSHSNMPNLPPPPVHNDDLGGQRKPVFLAELLDDDSVVEFYEQFARLAFGDSRGAVMTTCKVLRYRAPRNMNGKDGKNDDKEKGGRGMDGLGAKDGKVECAFCWTIKRDVFDIPMLIVGNFLPILPRPGEIPPSK